MKTIKKPILIIMAAGMGSRYGGLKQIEPVDEHKRVIIDFSIYDAIRAGFERVIFIIKPEMENDFNEIVGKRLSKHIDVKYAYQKLDDLPDGFSVPDGRQKPWGTAHAVLSARKLVDAPFAVINADDFYGAAAFKEIYEFLENKADEAHHAMVGFRIENTLTEYGSVARGICKADEHNNLVEVVERTSVVKKEDGAAFTEDGNIYTFLPKGTIVSMNVWGFGLSMMSEIEKRFAGFLEENLPANPLKCEYFLPLVANSLLYEKKAEIKVLESPDKWYGITYAEDMPFLKRAIAEKKEQGIYPKLLWEEE